jgi:hypothetical protein
MSFFSCDLADEHVADVLKVRTVLDCGLFEKIKIVNMGHCIQWLLNQGK